MPRFLSQNRIPRFLPLYNPSPPVSHGNGPGSPSKAFSFSASQICASHCEPCQELNSWDCKCLRSREVFWVRVELAIISCPQCFLLMLSCVIPILMHPRKDTLDAGYMDPDEGSYRFVGKTRLKWEICVDWGWKTSQRNWDLNWELKDKLTLER